MTHWSQESCDRRDDPVSGARIIQLASAAGMGNNVYGEQPYGSPDGQRIIIVRSNDSCFEEYGSLLVHELDTLRIKPVTLVVGNLETGKHRVLVEDTEASGGGNQCTPTHPYLTADNRYVIYNADPDGLTPQVYAARLPAGFIESLGGA